MTGLRNSLTMFWMGGGDRKVDEAGQPILYLKTLPKGMR